jgi:hypothetical protein
MDAPIVGRTAEQQAWQELIDRRAGARGSSLNFIIGDYGMGKSHSLYHIKKYCDARADVAAVIMKFLSEDELRNFGVDFVRRIFKSLDDDTKVVLRRLTRPRALTALRDHTDVIMKYVRDDSVAVTVLTGGKPTKTELNAAGIRRTLESTEVALEFLAALLSMLHQANRLSLVLCIDEAEYIFSQTNARKTALIFNSIRAIYDLPGGTTLGVDLAPLANIIFFFAISVAGWQRFNTLEKVERSQGGPIQPLITRIEKTINLSRLNRSETGDLVSEYLKTSRTEKKKLDNPLIPYDEDFVDYVFALTKGLPRDIVTRCDYVISEGLKDKVTQLTKRYAREVFTRWNLPA